MHPVPSSPPSRLLAQAAVAAEPKRSSRGPHQRLGGGCALCLQWSTRWLCGPCAWAYAAPRPRCPRCALPTPTADLCATCRREPPPYEACCVLFDYGFPWSRLIQALKFRQDTALARGFGHLMGERLAHSPEPAEPATLVVPVPLSPMRLRERGYNQAALLATEVARQRGLSRADALCRPLERAPQAAMNRRERLHNLQGVFALEPALRPRLHGRTVALVDDVVTTGATVTAASHELLRGGARRVIVWALARTPSAP